MTDVVAERFGSLHRGSPMLEWGSVTKTVTARIAEGFARAGILDLQAPVSSYLHESQLPDAVTIHSLVTHTSGLPRLPENTITTIAEARDPYAKFTTSYFDTEVIPGLAALPLGPVGVFEYSNLGYALLTRLLEVETGRGWWELAQQEVFAPFGITDVTVSPSPEEIPVLHNWAGRVRKQWQDTGPFIGAGGLHSTFDALEQYAIEVASRSKGKKPIGWMDARTLWWHNGHNRDHGAFAGFSHDGSRVVTAHTLGYRPGRADRLITRLERANQSPQ